MALLCLRLGWVSLAEVTLPSGRRADILALRPDGGFVAIEIKSGRRDYLGDSKWPDYLDYADTLLFAVDDAFPTDLLPAEVGLIVVPADPGGDPGGWVGGGPEAALLRPGTERRLAPARRRALLLRYAQLAAQRLAEYQDPEGVTALRAALRLD